MDINMGKTTEEIEAIRARMLANPQTAGIAHNVQDPNSKRFEEFRKKGNEAMKKLSLIHISEPTRPY